MLRPSFLLYVEVNPSFLYYVEINQNNQIQGLPSKIPDERRLKGTVSEISCDIVVLKVFNSDHFNIFF